MPCLNSHPEIPFSQFKKTLFGFFGDGAQRTIWEALAFCTVIGIHLALVIRMISVNVLFLGGDTTREAWRALMFLKQGRLVHDFGMPYESDFFSFLFVPFMLVFKNTIISLQIAGVSLTAATVSILYLFVRRTYGLTAAFFVGCIYAVSPLLMAHCTLFTLSAVPLFIGAILLMETAFGLFSTYLVMLAAGIFTSLQPYFLFPFFGYVAGRIRPGFFHLSLASCRKYFTYAFLFLLGLSPVIYKFTSDPSTSFLARHWNSKFVHANAMLFSGIFNRIGEFWIQLSWSLDSFVIYGKADAPFRVTVIVLSWVLVLSWSVFSKASRRWGISLVAGLIPACFIVSMRGLGMRHFMTFMPFYWLMLASLIAASPWRKGKPVFCLFAFIVAARYLYNDLTFLKNSEAVAPINDTYKLISFLALSPKKNIRVYSNNDNLFFDLKYFLPDKNVTLHKSDAGEWKEERSDRAIILVYDDAGNAKIPRIGDGKHYELGSYQLSGRTTYTLMCKKERFI